MVRQLLDQFILCVSIEQAADLLSLSRQTIYNLIDREGLPTVRFGKAVRIPVDSLREWLKQREEAQRA